MKREMLVLSLLAALILCLTIVLSPTPRLTLSAPHPQRSLVSTGDCLAQATVIS